MVYTENNIQFLNAHNFFEKRILTKFFLKEVLYDCFNFTYAYWNEGGKVREFHSCLKVMIQPYSHVAFFNVHHLSNSIYI